MLIWESNFVSLFDNTRETSPKRSIGWVEKERGATILMPTSMVDSMNPAVALALTGQQTAPQKANGPLPLTTRPQ
jgi:hypothetical protein